MSSEPQISPPKPRQLWSTVMSGVGSLSAILGLSATLIGGITWYQNHRKLQIQQNAQLSLATAQASQQQYAAAVQTDDEILKGDPLNQPALDQQLAITMLWVENFSVIAPDGQSATTAAAPALDRIFAILDAALTRTTGPAAADVQAHLGWAHWLNQHIAEREFGQVAEQNLRAALQNDPTNVYANAMLGNWMLQTHTSFPEAVMHLNAAVATGKLRPFVRTMQLGGLVYDEDPGTRAELVRAANQMRLGNEPLDPERRHRILSFCCDPGVTEHAALVESLSAIPADQALQTYDWLQSSAPDGMQRLQRDFVSASLLEISGNRPAAQAAYRSLQQQLAKQPGSLQQAVDDAISRMAH